MLKFVHLLLAVSLAAGPAQPAEIILPQELQTVSDGRPSLQSLYAAYATLADAGWTVDTIVDSQPGGTRYALPILALRSPVEGPATWIISGIHGEEPAGPAAIAAAIDAIAALGQTKPVVLLPLNNPHGYVRNWRYLNARTWSAETEAQSVGDSSHLLLTGDPDGRARAERASSPEAAALTGYVVSLQASYPPVVSIDLHEDNILEQGYVYSQGEAGTQDRFAREAIRVLRQQAIPIQLDGFTRFDEAISQGIIGPVEDSSIDELMSAGQIVLHGRTAPGPSAATVLVFETPVRQLALEARIDAHEALLRRMLAMISATQE